MLTKAQTAFTDFLEKQKAVDYKFGVMTKEQQDAEMLEYTTLKIAAAQEQEKNAMFLKERQAAFVAFDEKVNAERSALAVEWQAREDALV